MGRHGCTHGGCDSTRQTDKVAFPKKSLTRSISPGKAKLGRGLNLTRRGALLTSGGQRIDWLRTLASKGSDRLAARHLRFRRQAAGTRVLHCVLLDMSKSMLKGQKMAQAKGYLLSLSEQAYRQRDDIAVLGFSGEGARWIQPPGKAMVCNTPWIEPLGAGGGTPIGDALEYLSDLLRSQTRQQKVVHTWLLTDGRFVDLPTKPTMLEHCVVVDFEMESVALGRCQALAQEWGVDWEKAAIV